MYPSKDIDPLSDDKTKSPDTVSIVVDEDTPI